MLRKPVLDVVRQLKAVKSAVGDDVRPLEIFDYAATATTVVLDPFTPPMWFADIQAGNLVITFLRIGPQGIALGDRIEYEIGLSGNWIDTGAVWNTAEIIIPGPFPSPTTVRIRYIHNGVASPPSNIYDAFSSG